MIRALLVLAIALPAAAQQAPAPPAETKKEPDQRRPLNLRLDNPSSFATVAPAEKPPEKALPTLGGDARPVPQGRIRSDGTSGVFPPDTNPGN
jgi:hypothetical protein